MSYRRENVDGLQRPKVVVAVGEPAPTATMDDCSLLAEVRPSSCADGKVVVAVGRRALSCWPELQSRPGPWQRAAAAVVGEVEAIRASFADAEEELRWATCLAPNGQTLEYHRMSPDED